MNPLFLSFTGLEILAFPCNQFGAQEPGSNEEIVEFACTRFKAEYPIFDKVGRLYYLFVYLKCLPVLGILVLQDSKVVST